MKKNSLLFVFLLSTFIMYSQNVKKEGYKIVNKIHLTGDEKWDYLFSDDQAGRLYVSHGNMVHVVDEVKGTEIGKITDLKGVHGIAIAPAFNKGFISCGKDSSVTIFDTKTIKVLAKIKITGAGPDAIRFDPFSKNVFVFNGKSNNATVISAQTNQIVATIPFEGNPEFSVSDENGKVYVNLESKNSIAVINTTTNKVENVWSISPGEEPTGLALDNKTHRLFSVCKNKLMFVVNAENGKIITSLPIGERCDGAAFDPGLNCAYSSNGDVTMTVVKEATGDKYSVVENFPTQKGARTIAVNRETHHIYLPAADFDVPKEGEKPKIIPGTFVILDIAPI